MFGTVVDWRGTIVREGERLRAAGVTGPDWEVVAEAWRDKYAAALSEPWRPLDEILRAGGEALIGELGIRGLTGADREQWVNLWTRLDPWPDAVAGLTRLRSRFRVVAPSNANVALSRALAGHGGLPWDHILGPDEIRVYKPHPEVYGNALRELGLRGSEVMMVAAHLFDLAAAKRHEGFHTAFVHRPREEPGDPDRAGFVDLPVNDLIELADALTGPPVSGPTRS